MRAAHHRFAEGHRLAQRVSGGPADTLASDPEPVEVTIPPGASSLTFPSPVTAPARRRPTP